MLHLHVEISCKYEKKHGKLLHQDQEYHHLSQTGACITGSGDLGPEIRGRVTVTGALQSPDAVLFTSADDGIFRVSYL